MQVAQVKLKKSEEKKYLNWSRLGARWERGREMEGCSFYLEEGKPN